MDRSSEPATTLDALMNRHFAALNRDKAIARLWQRDGTLYAADPAVAKAVRNRLGWLFCLQTMRDHIERLTVLARVVERQGYDRVMVLGMGGSSLWPEVIGRHLRGRRGLPVRIADSTHPHAVAEVLAWSQAGKPLFVVATKSGGTVETISLYRALRQHFDDGQHFVAITDPGSGLEGLAKAEHFREIFLNPADIGGRFSAGSLFGLVPAVLAGAVLTDALQRVGAMLDECREEDAKLNPGANLGAFLAAAAETGRWQMRLSLGKDVRAFGAWIEQLVGESTGKHGKGVLPVPGGLDGGGDLAAKLEHAVVVSLTTFAHPDDDFTARATEAGVPVTQLVMPEAADLWTEIVRWEFATAIAGWLLQINPFDEPDVGAAKAATGALLDGSRRPTEPDRRLAIGQLTELGSALRTDLAALATDDYLALLCYLPPTMQNQQRLEALRESLQRQTSAAVTVQFGPRYLHSTGQFHKGGLARGLFVVVHDFASLDAGDDIAIPGSPFSFLTLARAQAAGDVAVLKERGKPVFVAELARA